MGTQLGLRRFNFIKVSVLFKLVNWFYVIPSKILTRLFDIVKKLILKFI
jgi:hypothetical protein